MKILLENPYVRLIVSSIQSKMEYRGTFLVFLLTILGFYLSQVAVIALMLYKFKTIKGWNSGELALLYTLLIFSMGVVSTIFSGMIDFSDFIRKGDYDRVLLRPLSTIGQILSMNFDLTGLAHLSLGFVALVITNHLIHLNWNFANIFYFIITIVGGSLILGSIRIIVASVCFYAISNESLQHLIVFSSREFLMYPLNIYTRAVQIFLTFIFPIAFVNYYPSYYFLSKDPSMIFHPYLIYGTLPMGLFLFVVALFLWRLGERYYGSTGS
jgi:ABC-2 type transport system permease protein